jgi:PAS domain S-box-containing protein
VTDTREIETVDRARQIVDGLGEGFLGLDADWRVTDCNAAALTFLSCEAQDLKGRKVWEISGLAMEGAFGELAQRVARTRASEDAEIACPRDEGERLVQVRIFPMGSGIGVVLRDITDIRAAEHRLAESEARYRELADGTPAAAWLSRADGELEFINPAMADTLGRSPESLLGEGWMAAIDPDDRSDLLKVRRRARRSHGAFHYEGRFRRADGALRVVQLYGRPRFERSGAFRGHVGMASDVTEARAAEGQQKLLIDELNHRVKNTLATVQSLVSQTLREADVACDVAGMVVGRLMALSAAHNVLNREQWNGAEVAAIVEAVAGPYVEAQRITVAGPSAWLEPSGAVTLAMALHELSVNAVKHGAFSTQAGQVKVTWTRFDDCIALEWREVGGPRVTSPDHRGFGSRLLSRLKAEMEFAAEGLICRISLPAPSDGGGLLRN